MNLSYQAQDSTKWNDISVEFDPPLSGYEEVKPRLLQMKADAEEGLGMVSFSRTAGHIPKPLMRTPFKAKSPRLTTFGLRAACFQTFPFLIILLVLTLAPYEHHPIAKEDVPLLLAPTLPTLNAVSQTLSQVRQTIPYKPTAAYIVWGTIIAIHIALTLLVAFFAYKRRAGFRLGVSRLFPP